jgi:hypothetical protein
MAKMVMSPSCKKTTLLMSSDLWLKAKHRALEENKSLRKLMAEALIAYLGTKQRAARKGGVQC